MNLLTWENLTSDMSGLTAAAMSNFPSSSNSSLQADLARIETAMNSDDFDIQLEASRTLRVLLSTEKDNLVRQVLERDWTPRLVRWLKNQEHPSLQLEALWALTNVAADANDTTSVLMQNGVVPILIPLLGSENEEVLEQSAWILGNMATDSITTRDAILTSGAIRIFVKVLRKCSTRVLRMVVFAICNLCDGQPRPVFDISELLPALGKVLTSKDVSVLSYVSWTLSHLCDGPSGHIHPVVNSEACSKLVRLLAHESDTVSKPALRTIGNIVCAEDDHDYTQHIIDCGAVPSLKKLINHSAREIQKEACWTLSNIAAGTIDQIQCVLESGSIPPLVRLATDVQVDSEVKSEACWVILNAASCGSDSQIEYLVKSGCVSVLSNLLNESSMVLMALEGIERILQVGEMQAKHKGTGNPYTSIMAATKIKNLEDSKAQGVAKRASRIWRHYFVTCAICGGVFSRNSDETFFCDECKCNVCRSCNCTVYHLDYQESLWKEETVKEKTEKEAKQQSKKNKRLKKRQRTKERKALLKQEQKTGTRTTSLEDDEDDSGSDSGNFHGDLEEVIDSEKKADPPDPTSKDCCGGKIPEHFKADDIFYVSPGNKNSRRNIVHLDSADCSPSSSKLCKSILEAYLQEGYTSPEMGIILDDLLKANDKWVSYLLETRSILALDKGLGAEDYRWWNDIRDESPKEQSV